MFFFHFSTLFCKKIRNQTGSSEHVRTFAGGVKQRSLERDNLHVIKVFLNGHLNCEAGVWVDIGEGQQICGAHKEVSVERVDGQTCIGTERNKNQLNWTA